MHPIDFLALLEAAGLPPGLPLRLTDVWVAHRLGVDERTARRWRLSGRMPRPVIIALQAMRDRVPSS